MQVKELAGLVSDTELQLTHLALDLCVCCSRISLSLVLSLPLSLCPPLLTHRPNHTVPPI